MIFDLPSHSRLLAIWDKSEQLRTLTLKDDLLALYFDIAFLFNFCFEEFFFFLFFY